MINEIWDDISYPQSVILDPSLLTSSGQELLRAMLEEEQITFVATPIMQDILGNRDALRRILELWGEYPGQINLAIQQIDELELLYRIKIHESKESMQWLIEETLSPEIKYYISRSRYITSFIANEIAVALITGNPIFCVISNPERKITDFMQKIGCKIRKTIEIQADRKAKFLKTKDFRKLVLASALSAGFVYVIGASALTYLGCVGITAVVFADP